MIPSYVHHIFVGKSLNVPHIVLYLIPETSINKNGWLSVGVDSSKLTHLRSGYSKNPWNSSQPLKPHDFSRQKTVEINP